MARKIEIELNEKKYVLEYTRNGIRKAEAAGLNFANLSGGAITTPTTLFYGAFHKHHPDVTLEMADLIYDEVADNELIKVLSEMAVECVEKMYSEKPKNAKWKVVG